jgi:hypothetical protein
MRVEGEVVALSRKPTRRKMGKRRYLIQTSRPTWRRSFGIANSGIRRHPTKKNRLTPSRKAAKQILKATNFQTHSVLDVLCDFASLRETIISSLEYGLCSRNQ